MKSFDGHTLCLRVGERCPNRLAGEYPVKNFVCVAGRLQKIPTPPPAPKGPKSRALALPVPSPRPATATTIKLPGDNPSNPDVTLAATSDAIWTATGPDRIESATNAVSGPFATGSDQDVGVGDGSVWVSDYNANQVLRLDPTDGKRQAVLQLPADSNPEGIATTPGAVWVANHHGGTLSRIDPRTNRIVATVVLTYPGEGGPQGVAAGLGSVWVDVPNINAVVRINPATNRITSIIAFPVDLSPCGGIAVGTTAVWVSDCLDGTDIARINPATNTIAAIFNTGGEIVQPAADGNTVWFVAGADPDEAPAPASLIQLNDKDAVTARIALPTGFVSGGATVAFGSIWIADFQSPEVMRIPRPG